MMKLMNKKLTKKGFTLAELLIVVAILAILVAVSIPIFTSKLDDARKSTDLANERAAKAAAVVEYMDTNVEGATGAVYYVYDANNGKVETGVTSKPTSSTVKGYNQQDTKNTKVVLVTIADSGESVSTEWIPGATA